MHFLSSFGFNPVSFPSLCTVSAHMHLRVVPAELAESSAEKSQTWHEREAKKVRKRKQLREREKKRADRERKAQEREK